MRLLVFCTLIICSQLGPLAELWGQEGPVLSPFFHQR